MKLCHSFESKEGFLYQIGVEVQRNLSVTPNINLIVST